MANMRKGVGITLLFFLALCGTSTAQEEANNYGFLNRVFLPSLEVGYVRHASDALADGLLMKTSLEYRVRRNNDIFLRLNWDNHDSRYEIQQQGLTNVLTGTARFTEILIGPGYRMGDSLFRVFVLVQGGIRRYDYPVLEQQGMTLATSEKRGRISAGRLTIGGEYYLDDNTAVTLDVLYGLVWDRVDFWTDRGGSFGASLGFITSLF